MLRWFSLKLRRMRRDETGSITIELMLWMPILILWLVFSVGVFNAYISRNQTAKAAHTLADIISRKTEWNGAAFNEIYELEGKLLSTAAAGFDLRVTSVQRIGADHVVQWSSSSGTLAPLTEASLPLESLPAMADLDTVIYTEVIVPWVPFSKIPGLTAHTWHFGIPSRPRFVPAIISTD